MYGADWSVQTPLMTQRPRIGSQRHHAAWCANEQRRMPWKGYSTNGKGLSTLSPPQNTDDEAHCQGVYGTELHAIHHSHDNTRCTWKLMTLRCCFGALPRRRRKCKCGRGGVVGISIDRMVLPVDLITSSHLPVDGLHKPSK